MEYHIVVIKVGARTTKAAEVQRLLTENGCMIKVRLGLHDLPEGSCASSGLIILEVIGSDDEIQSLVAALDALEEVTAKHIML